MVFWRTYNNKVYDVGTVDQLGFSISDPSFIPNDYLDRKEFIILRTCFGIGDWGIISAFPRKLKEKYPDCKVYIPSPSLLRSMFGHLEKNWSSWDDPFQVVHSIFFNNPYIEGFIDSFEGEVFNDHFRIYDNSTPNEPLLQQIMRFWQFDSFNDIEPEIYWTDSEKALGDKIIKEHIDGDEFCTLLISNRFDGTGADKIQEILNKNKLPTFYWTPKQDSKFDFNPALDLRHVDIRIQLYLKSKASYNVGNQTGVNDTIANYATTYTLPRGELGSNYINSQIYI